MPLKLVQAGQGDTRDIALLYKTGSEAPKLAQALGPNVCVVAETDGSFGDGLTTEWEGSLAFAQEQAGPFSVGRLWLIGFSAGCQGVRWLLATGAPAHYVIAADGIHLPLGTPTELQTRPWLDMASRARAGNGVFFVSVSKTGADNFSTTRASAEFLFGTKECLGSYASPCVRRSGNFAIYGATGLPDLDPATEHMNQLRVLLPRMIADAKDAGGSRNAIVAALSFLFGGALCWKLNT